MTEQRENDGGLARKLECGKKLACTLGLGVTSLAGLVGFGAGMYCVDYALDHVEELDLVIGGIGFIVGFFGGATLGALGTGAGVKAFNYTREMFRGNYSLRTYGGCDIGPF